MRGKLIEAKSFVDGIRITPAGAGKTLRADPAERRYRDHPRRCGENSAFVRFREKQVGSPPQVRGKHSHNKRGCVMARITPAGAGKTKTVRILEKQRRDHPRRCGENSVLYRRMYINSGSPPQVRGKHEPCGNKAKRTGITPAGAGKTRKIFRAIW